MTNCSLTRADDYRLNFSRARHRCSRTRGRGRRPRHSPCAFPSWPPAAQDGPRPPPQGHSQLQAHNLGVQTAAASRTSALRPRADVQVVVLPDGLLGLPPRAGVPVPAGLSGCSVCAHVGTWSLVLENARISVESASPLWPSPYPILIWIAIWHLAGFPDGHPCTA